MAEPQERTHHGHEALRGCDRQPSRLRTNGVRYIGSGQLPNIAIRSTTLEKPADPADVCSRRRRHQASLLQQVAEESGEQRLNTVSGWRLRRWRQHAAVGHEVENRPQSLPGNLPVVTLRSPSAEVLLDTLFGQVGRFEFSRLEPPAQVPHRSQLVDRGQRRVPGVQQAAAEVLRDGGQRASDSDLADLRLRLAHGTLLLRIGDAEKMERGAWIMPTCRAL